MVETACQEIIECLSRTGRIGVAAHERPDGDALGSALGLGRLLRNMGRDATIFVAEPVAPRYRFLYEPEELTDPSAAGGMQLDALVVLDSADLQRLGAFVSTISADVTLINIDHHMSNTGFGHINWIDSEASSTGEMIYHLAQMAGWPVGRGVADALWTALVTDTGRFSYSNTRPDTLRTAAALLEAGVHPDVLYRHLYEDVDPREMRLTQRAMSRLELIADGRLALLWLSEEDFAEEHCGPQQIQELVNQPLALHGVEASILLYEMPGEDQTKVSVRTYPPHDAVAFCRSFGGGGHVRAAGATVVGSVAGVRARVLQAARSIWFPEWVERR